MDIGKIEKITNKTHAGKIKITDFYEHTKASEKYVRVQFVYDGGTTWDGAVPIEFPRGGIHSDTPEEAAEVIIKSYKFQDPKKESEWTKSAEKFWAKSSSNVTLPIFKSMMDSKWKCVSHLAKTNNPQRRIQDIKDKGFTLATDTGMYCKICKKKNTHHILLRLPIGALRKYETWSPELRKTIVFVLKGWDVYENRKAGADILPDHKFPETRWDTKTSEKNPDSMTDDQIRQKFQLLTNRRNEQKREVCRNCYQTGKRGYPYGIKYFYSGNENWPEAVPKRGKKAEKGCVGCGWYDTAKWRDELNKKTLR